jgi:phosphotransferase system IIB component
MEIAPSLDQYLKSLEKENDFKKIASQQTNLQIQLMEAQGLSADALAAKRQIELQTLDASLRPLQEQIWAQQDLNKAMDATSANMKKIADQRYGLETRLLQAQGDTAALRERELALLDESNRPLQEQIWALEDAAKVAQESADAQARAYEDASRAAQEAADLQAQLIKQTQDSLTNAIKKLRGESESLNDLDRQRAKNTLNAALAAAQSGQSIVGFAGLEDAVNKISEIDKSKFVSYEDYQRELGRTLSILDRLSGYAGMPTSSTNPIISNGALAMQAQTNQQVSANIAAVEDQMTKLTVQIEDNTKRTTMMLERWEKTGMPFSRTA